MDGISPYPKSEADARHELRRLAEILPRVADHLRTLGVPAEAVAGCQRQAGQLAMAVMQAREASLLHLARAVGA